MFLKIVFGQARYRWGVSLLILLAMTSLVSLYVYSKNTTGFANRSMQLVMKNMGHNLLIFPKNADPRGVYFCTEDQVLFPEETTERMSKMLGLCSRYYVSVLQGKVEVDGQQLILTGIEPVARKDETREKQNMVLPLPEGEARLGYEAARLLEKKVGDTLRIRDEQFKVVEILPPKATADDCRVYVNLDQCQEMLQQQGQINFILAFLCLSGKSLQGSLEMQEQNLAEKFPEFRQVSRMDIAQGRYLARVTTQKFLKYLLLLVAAATVVVIAVTGLQEVSDRRHETGIMIAMGVSHAYVVCLYVVKTLVLAVIASVVGFLAGSALAVYLTAPVLVVNTRPVTVLWDQFPAVLGLTCAVAVLAETVPVIKLLRLDPNTILTGE